MGIVALVMAGGRGTRMKIKIEKPLVEVGGKPVIEYVISALKSAKKIKTPGVDYVSDMGYTVQALKLGVFLAVAADLPLIRPEMVDAVVTRYEQCGKPALTVAVPLETKVKLGMSIEYSFKTEDSRDVVPVGINVIDGSKRYGDEWLDQDICVLNYDELAVNINTVQELQLAEQLLTKKKL